MDNSSEHLITGVRVRVEIGAKSTAHMSFRILNRVVKLKAKGTLWYDFALCDAEAIYGSLHNLETEFITEDSKVTPIRILSIEIFV